VGKYNPYRPIILGNEWPGIHKEPYVLDAEVERGHTFQLDTTSTIVSGTFFLDESLPRTAFYTGPLISLYREGEEDLTGPAKKLIIPCEAGTIVTGGSRGTPSIVGASTIGEALRSPSDGSLVQFGEVPPLSTGGLEVDITFDVDAYAGDLQNKRILNVTLLYILAGGPVNDGGDAVCTIETKSASGSAVEITWETDPIVHPSSLLVTEVSRADLGNMMPYTTNSYLTRRKYPWTYTDLLRFNTGAGNQIYVTLDTINLSSVDPPGVSLVQWLYAALEVTYAEETRLAYGATSSLFDGSFFLGRLDAGQNVVHLRTANTTLVTGTTLSPGNYTVTLTLGDSAPRTVGAAGNPPNATVRALRQLYALPTHQGVQIVRSLKEGGVPRKSEIDVLPQIMLHSASAAITGVHAYGTYLDTPVYDGVTLTQGVLNQSGGAAVAYPQVRFYARRFGDTDVDLTLRRVTAPTQVVTISPADFDALPEIVDGWREVTLRFTDIPLFSNTGASSEWEWLATGLLVGNQWQVLAPRAETTLTGAYDLAPTTYGGTTARLSHDGDIYGTADVTLLFSQDPPDVTGLALDVASQVVTGIGLDCATLPDCVPSGIGYHEVTWVPLSSIPASGFGYYELQRTDSVDNEWFTIMKATSINTSSFNDYEARVGVQSSYRIRAANVYEFFGAWSSTVSSTLPAPGVSGVGDGNSVLIFTTNERQSGSSNLAYTMTWEGGVEEDFSYPEGSATQLRELYQRDYVIALRPTERGGERFSRTILVNNAAVPSGLITNGFRSLRDMAWTDVSYVCVRNELGDRWLASVSVPSGRIKRNRQLYLARIDVAEVTDTPSQVDPST
jgi:hypothetical protein